MSRIHVNRDRLNLGQFSPEEVAEGLRNGRFRPGDLGWRAGMETWQPLSAFTDLPEVESETPPEVPPADISPAGDEPFPWDRKAEIGFFPTLAETVFQTLGRPVAAFRRLAAEPAMLGPYFFYLLVAMTAFAIYSAEILVFLNYSFSSLASSPELAKNPETAQAMKWLKDFGVIWFAFLLVVIVPCVPFIGAGIYHLLLMLFGGANGSFTKTFAVTCYVFGSASPLMILPCCGPFAMAIWTLISLSLGLAAAHRTDTWRSSLAVVIPFVFCCGGYMALNLIATMNGFSGATAGL